MMFTKLLTMFLNLIFKIFSVTILLEALGIVAVGGAFALETFIKFWKEEHEQENSSKET